MSFCRFGLKADIVQVPTVTFKGEKGKSLERNIEYFYKQHPEYVPFAWNTELSLFTNKFLASGLLSVKELLGKGEGGFSKILNSMLDSMTPESVGSILEQWRTLLSINPPKQMTEENRNEFFEAGVELMKKGYAYVISDNTEIEVKRGYSQILERILRADILYQTKLLAKDKYSAAQINPYKGVFYFLAEEDVFPFHAFAISAIEGTPILQTPYKDLETQLKGKMEELIGAFTAYASAKAHINQAYSNMKDMIRHAIEQPEQQEFILSETEADVLTEMIKIFCRENPSVSSEFSELYGQKSFNTNNLPRTIDGRVVIKRQDLIKSKSYAMVSMANAIIEYNAHTISAISHLLKSLEKNNPNDLEFKQLLTRRIIRSGLEELPSGPSIEIVFHFLKELSEPKLALDQLLKSLKAPQLRFFKAHLAQKTNELIQYYESKKQFEDLSQYRGQLQKLAGELALSLDKEFAPLATSQDVDGVMKRFNLCISGQEEAKALLAKELKRMVSGEGSYVPLLYLDGPYGVGKTSFGLKLAQELNARRSFQAHSTGIEQLDAQPASAAFYNAAIFQCLNHSDTSIDNFTNRLFDFLREAYRNAQESFPGQPSVLVIDEIGSLLDKQSEQQYTHFDCQKAKLLADVLDELRQKKQVTDPRTGELYSFQSPILVMTGNVTVEGNTNPFDTPFFLPEVTGESGAKLFSELKEGRSVVFSPLTRAQLSEQLGFYLDTLVPTAASLKGYIVRIDPKMKDILLDLYEDSKMNGRELYLHIMSSLIRPLLRREEIPATELMVSIHKDKFKEFDVSNLEKDQQSFEINTAVSLWQ